jgi:hypothetical protein
MVVKSAAVEIQQFGCRQAKFRKLPPSLTVPYIK